MVRYTDMSDTSPAIWTVGDRILEYEVTGLLGQGGMGTVYKVYDSQWKTTRAVKSPRPDIFRRAGGKENFVREAETWIKLLEHPHIVTCYFVRTLGGIPRIFTEYAEGGSLADWIRQGRLTQDGPERALERILDVAIQFAWGLHAAHEQGLVHQDIKPANVLLTRQGIAKVTDFGLAKARAMAGEAEREEGEDQQSLLVSSGGMTLAYCSPEQMEHQGLTRKTDIWSWGVSVLEMFVGAVTWKVGALAREALASHQRANPAQPLMPAEMVKVLNRCFQRQPDARPATMQEVAIELQAIYERLLGQAYARKAPAFRERGAETLYSQAASLLELGRFEEALATIERGILLAPKQANVYYGKGSILREFGRFEEALVAYEQSLLLEPELAAAHLNTGEILLELGRFEEALAAFEQSLQIEPKYTLAHHNKGAALYNLGRFEEALVAVEQGIQLNPKQVNAYYGKGAILLKLGRFEEALATIEQSLLLDPKKAAAHLNKGGVLLKLGRFEEALSAAEQAIRLAPTNAQARHLKGVALRLLK